MTVKTSIIAVLLWTVATFSLAAQTAAIQGLIKDAETQETLIGATVLIVGTTTGTSSDYNGQFLLSNLEAGTYDLKVSYISYQTLIISKVVVEGDKVVTLNISLLPESENLTEVVVEAKALQNNASAILAKQMESINILDGISADEFQKFGDNDAGGALRRVVGVSVESGKYVYVRGLGDRYNKVSLNGGQLPSLDPNKNAVQMDLFPSSLLDNIVVYKTYTPDLPASFSGGYIDLTVKDFPDTRIFKASASVGYNPQGNFNSQFITYKSSSLDAFALNSNDRAIPAEVLNTKEIPTLGQTLTSSNNYQKLSSLTQSFNDNIAVTNQASFLNHNLALIVGDQKSIGKKPFGYLLGLNYQRSFDFYEAGKTERYTLNTSIQDAKSLIPQLQLEDSKSDDNVLLGALFNASLRLSNRHKLSTTLIHNRTSTKTTRVQEGTKPEDDLNLFYQTRALLYQMRNLSTAQIRGHHDFGSKLKVYWMSSYVLARQSEPDLRFFTNGYRLNSAGEREYSIEPSIGQIPTRYWRSMRQTNLHSKFDLTYTHSKALNFKVGLDHVFRDRTFTEDQYRYDNQSKFFDGNWVDYISAENILQPNSEGIYILDARQSENNYTANQTIFSAYAMNNWTWKKWKGTWGLRIESTDMYLVSENKRTAPGGLENLDFLPAANVTYQPHDKLNLRLAYGKTLARPTFRELAPYASFDFVGDFILIGNPDLKRSLIDNFDLRLEYALSRLERLSVSGFYKSIEGAIERIDNPVATNAEINFRNLSQTDVLGVEAEFKLALNRVAKVLKPFFLAGNASWIISRAIIPDQEYETIKALEPDADRTRQLYGQSPYVINLALQYDNTRGTQANLNFNVQGPRLFLVMRGANPDVFEQPRPNLNFAFSQQLSDRFKLSLRCNNLLNPEFAFTQTFKGQRYDFQSYRVGRSFSMGFSYSFE